MIDEKLLPYVKVMFKIKFPSGDVENHSFIAKSVSDAEEDLEHNWRYKTNKGYEVVRVTACGKPIDELEAGDIVERQWYSSTFTIKYVKRVTKLHIILQDDDERKYRRSTGQLVGSDRVYLRQYDQDTVDMREKKKVLGRKVNQLQQVNWLRVKEEELEKVYNILRDCGAIVVE